MTERSPPNDAATSPDPTAGQALRRILAGDVCVVAASVYDPLSARIAQTLGHAVGVIGGSIASHTVLGAPDLILLTADELVEQARRTCRAASLAVIVDADHGYGNALNAMRTVQALQAAGVAGITIEDTLLPRAFGAGKAAQLTTVAEGVGKMKAALQGRGRGDAVILGRTSAASITGVDDAIARLVAYQDAGVDALFVPGLASREQLEAIARAVTLPLVIGGAKEALYDPSWLASLGVRAWLWGHQPFTVALQALADAMAAAHRGTPPSRLATPEQNALLARLTRASDYDRLASDWLDNSDRDGRNGS